MNFLIWGIFLVYVETIGIGTALVARRKGLRFPWLSLIPFAAFFYIDRLTDDIKVLSIRVGSWGKTVIITTVICLLAFLYAWWGQNNINPVDSAALTEIMLVPIVVCLFIFWLGTISSTTAVLNVFGMRFKYDSLVCALILPVPVLLIVAGLKSQNGVRAV